MAGFIDDLKNTFRNGNVLVQLILINAILFLAANIFVRGFEIEAFATNLALPGLFEWYIYKPWTLITYMFLHLDLGHVFWNMVWLYSLGRIFNDLIGNKRLLWVYILGGISGAVLYLVTNEVRFMGSPLLGASAGVMAVVVAVAAFAPNYVVHLFLFGPVRLKYIALISFVITTVIDFNMNTGGKVAHIGGALFGLLYGLQYKRGTDLSKGFEAAADSVGGLFSRKKKSPLKVSYKRKTTDEEYNASKVVEQQVIDAILDKISRSGYDSLSKKEKEILFKASNKDKR